MLRDNPIIKLLVEIDNQEVTGKELRTIVRQVFGFEFGFSTLLAMGLIDYTNKDMVVKTYQLTNSAKEVLRLVE